MGMKTVEAILVFLFITSQRLPVEEECCKSKKVGNFGYTLLYDDSTQVDQRCLNGCIYKREGDEKSRFCFAAGNLMVECMEEPENLQSNTCNAIANASKTKCVVSTDNCTKKFKAEALGNPKTSNCICKCRKISE